MVFLRVVLFLFALPSFIGCQVHFSDPYSGQYDPNRSVRSEGLISTIYHIWAVGRPEGMADADQIHRQLIGNIPCTDSWRARRILKKVHEEVVEDFSAEQAVLSNNGHLLSVSLSGEDVYDSGHEHISPTQYGRLSRLINHLQSYASLRVTVIGHADSVDTEAYNHALSARRATHIARYVVENNVPSETVTVKALGEKEPAVPNSTAGGRAQNRRVTLEICST